MSAVSYCGRYRILEAGIGDAYTVLRDLSHDERAEAERLGVKLDPTYREVAEGRAFVVKPTRPPYTPLVLFGVSEEGCIWLLPSQYCVEHHGRMLGNRRICRWFIEHCFELAGPKATTLYNGVTGEATSIINWLKKCCGARFTSKPIPTKHNGALALPFIIDRPVHV